MLSQRRIPLQISNFLVDGPVSHATGGCDGRQEGCERGYYHLHRNLNETLLLHHSFLISHSSFHNY